MPAAGTRSHGADQTSTTSTSNDPTTTPETSDSSCCRLEYIHAKILHDHLEAAFREAPQKMHLPQSLALTAALDALTTRDGEDTRAPGGLSPDDLKNLSAESASPVLSARFCRQLETELRRTLLSIASYWSADDDPEEDEERWHTLPEQIRERKDALMQQDEALRDGRSRVLRLIEYINKAQPALRSKLVDALSALPPHLRAARAAEADVTAATIETALLKLSLIRARAHRALYGHTLPNRPGATVARAVNVAHEKLKERERAQEAEMRKLDAQIEDYESTLRLVDGRDGSFSQVVRDMARVKKETEECRKDLRRLGWTGD